MVTSLLLNFGHVPSWQLFELLSFFVHCCFCIRNFHRLEEGNELAREIVITQRVEHLFPAMWSSSPFDSFLSELFLVDA